MAQNRSCSKRRRDSEGKKKNCCFSFDIYREEMDIKTVGVPDIDNLDKINLAKRWRYHQWLREQSQKIFRDEYLGLLVQRPLKRKFVRPIEINNIVLVGTCTYRPPETLASSREFPLPPYLCGSVLQLTAEMFPLVDISAEAVDKTFDAGWNFRFGPVLRLTTDQGTQFESSLFEVLSKF
ncbi:hypothetical protein NPIL_702061 [Nephila pilipes]|uniref:Integrase catalytic domain-containing protein n=1 Tax=Nephila pilipes TaxID=299642 RepID=A0A8X6UEL9_NEPPI|nr:hypothetical protein NPIL_702061 [Nephila pilipes]